MKVASVWILAIAFVTSCAGTDVGNGVVDIDFAIYNSGTSSAESQRVSQAAPVGIEITNAWVAVERIRFRDAANCSGSSEAEFAGPFAVDMLSVGIPNSLDRLQVPFIDYCRFEFRWDVVSDAELANIPAELVGASILIEGTRDDGKQFVVRSKRSDELRLNARDDVFSVAETTSALFVAFDVQTLFDGVDLDNATVGSNGRIRIENGNNDDLLSVFDDNLAIAVKLFDDNDGDKQLDPDERDDTDVLAE